MRLFNFPGRVVLIIFSCCFDHLNEFTKLTNGTFMICTSASDGSFWEQVEGSVKS